MQTAHLAATGLTFLMDPGDSFYDLGFRDLVWVQTSPTKREVKAGYYWNDQNISGGLDHNIIYMKGNQHITTGSRAHEEAHVIINSPHGMRAWTKRLAQRGMIVDPDIFSDDEVFCEFNAVDVIHQSGFPISPYLSFGNHFYDACLSEALDIWDWLQRNI